MSEQSQLGGKQAWINWILGTAYVVFVFTLQTGYAITNLAMSEDLGISAAQIGVIGSIYTWAFAVAQFGSGSIMDKLGARWTMPIAAAVVTAGAFLFASADGAAQLIVAQVLMALGAAFGFVGAGFVGGQWFAPIKFGFMFALVQFVASLSAIAGQNLIGAYIADTPWNTIIYAMAMGGAVLTVVMFIVMRDPVRDDMQQDRKSVV
jgi:MFS family permease